MMKLLTTQEVSETLRISKKTLYRMISSGELRAVHVGHVYRIHQEDLTIYLENNVTAASRLQSRKVLSLR